MRRHRNSGAGFVFGEYERDLPRVPLTPLETDFRIRRALELMETGLGSRLTAVQIAHEVGLSRSHFHRLFKTATQRSFRQRLLEMRLQRACELLADLRLSVKEVGYQVGFATAPAFCRAFTKGLGESPSRWRRQHVGIRNSTNG